MKTKSIMRKIALCLCLALLLTGLSACSNKNSTSGNNTQQENSTGNSENTNGTGDMINGTDQNGTGGAGDMINGENGNNINGNGVNGEAGNGINGTNGTNANGMGKYDFTKYDDAHDYFLEQINKANDDNNYNGKFELRNESHDTENISDSSEGYHFRLYDTSNDKNGILFGDYYLDTANGDIYKKNTENGNIEPYNFGDDMRQ